MPVLSSEQMRAWDEYAMQYEPIASIDLMERAAGRCFQWLQANHYLPDQFSIFCGKGNNGGDGLALARMLVQQESKVSVYILEFGHKGTEDFQQNLSRLHNTSAEIKFIQAKEKLSPTSPSDIIIDALLGSGLSRPVDGFTANVIDHINESGNEVISIDIPSGLYVDKSSKGNLAVKAAHTLSFQSQKPAFLVAENADFIGKVHILDIGLLPGFLHTIKPAYDWIDRNFIASIYKPRNEFAHKGKFGHALIVSGSYGKMGAAVLCTRACLRSGAGLVTVHMPFCGLNILQISAPEAMCDPDGDEHINTIIKTDLHKFNAMGIGPGIGTAAPTANMLKQIFSDYKSSIVLDADALNIVAAEKLLEKIPQASILTPHPREFERLFGQSENDFARIEKAKEQARALQSTIVLKGHYSFIADPDGSGYFNSTGNAGMAKGGTGDVLTGLITGLAAQKYLPTQAAILGVYWHGAAGDLAASYLSQEAMLASDLVDHLGMVILSQFNSEAL